MRFCSRLAVLACALQFATPVLAATELPELRWFRGNTHTHTINSDGDSTPDAVTRWYREHGYQFLFITDHEYVTDVAPLNAMFAAKDRFLVLSGQEITQVSDDPARYSAHINSLFTEKVIWPIGVKKCIPTACGTFAPADMPLSETFDANIAAVRAQGGLPQVNHPNHLWSMKPADLNSVPDGTLIEIWNGQGAINNLGGDDEAGDVRPSAEGFWDHLLSLGKVIWGVGSDDSHFFRGDRGEDHSLAAGGQAWIMVRARELTPATIKGAMAAGEFYSSTGVTLSDVRSDDAGLSLTIREAKPGAARYRTRFIGQGGAVLAEIAGVSPVYRFQGGETYVRASVIDSNGNRAWTQPVFRDGRKRRTK